MILSLQPLSTPRVRAIRFAVLADTLQCGMSPFTVSFAPGDLDLSKTVRGAAAPQPPHAASVTACGAMSPEVHRPFLPFRGRDLRNQRGPQAKGPVSLRLVSVVVRLPYGSVLFLLAVALGPSRPVARVRLDSHMSRFGIAAEGQRHCIHRALPPKRYDLPRRCLSGHRHAKIKARVV